MFSTFKFVAVKMRSSAICIMNFFWAGGASLTSLVALLFLGDSRGTVVDVSYPEYPSNVDASSGWRSLVACCSLPLFLFVVLAYKYLPETPRFSITRGNPIEASIVLKKFADENKRNCPVGNLTADQTSPQGEKSKY